MTPFHVTSPNRETEMILRVLPPIVLLCLATLMAEPESVCGQDDRNFRTIQFDSADGVKITADLYMSDDDHSKPFIVLCHQAGWSRGEYREIAPKLNQLGFNCMAIDQRSGDEVNGVKNDTAVLASQAGKSTEYVDAEQDMIAALKYARKNFADGKLVLWGSSYSAALALRVAGEQPSLVDGVLAFAPGEYFRKSGKPGDWITSSARKIRKPVFITSRKDEYDNWKSIYEAVTADGKVKFVPGSAGNHGSRALWNQFSDSQDYWQATRSFLKKFR